MKLYTLENFRRMLDAAGLRLDTVHGGYDEEEYDTEASARMIFMGGRP